MAFDFILYAIWAFGLFALVRAIYKTIKNRGLRGFLFGAPILKTLGEIDLGRTGRVSTPLKLHVLDPQVPGTPSIGIEVVNLTFASYRLFSIPLTTDQARSLRDLLSRAVA